MVVQKPCGMPCQLDRSGALDLLTLLKQDVKTRFGKPGKVYLGLVHRLDRPVGGVMVVARTSKAAARLSEQLRRRLFHKVYLAVVHGVPPPGPVRLRDFLLKHGEENLVKVVPSGIEGAKEAILNYTMVAHSAEERLSLLKVELATGRPHQIRVQLARAGFPLCGDRKYGQNRSGQYADIALWSWELGFHHPTRNEEMLFRAPPPAGTPWHLFPGKVD